MSESLAPPQSVSRILILDAWPILEWLRGNEPASSAFEQILIESDRGTVSFAISRINFGEIFYILTRDSGEESARAKLAALEAIPIQVVAVDDESVHEAALLKARYSISYADAFAAALAIRHNTELVTGDHDFQALEQAGILKLRWLGA